MKTGLKIPKISRSAERLLLLCLLMIVYYLFLIALLFSKGFYDAKTLLLLKEMLNSAALSAVLALGGSLLYDLDTKNKK